MGVEPAKATINKEVGVSRITYVITADDLDSVLEAIRGLFVKYDPRGYGTSVETIHHGIGGWHARVTRSHSCD